MSDYGIYDFEWIRGTTSPLILLIEQNALPLAFDDARLSVWDASKTLAFRLSLAANPGTGPGTASKDIVTGAVTFQPTAAQTRLLTESKHAKPGKNHYEVEIRNGANEDVYMMGTIAGIGGINDDEV